MRYVFGVISALTLVCALSNGAFAAGPAERSVFDEVVNADAAFRDGQVDAGLSALQRASDRGDLRALLWIGKIYDEGKLVARDRLKACRSYSLAMERVADFDRFNPDARLAAEAFRRSAECYAKGLPVEGWERNMSAVADLYFHAGVILQDPASLFELAKLYLNGDGITQNTAMAIYFLDSAARKGYPPAQAMLGSMMWEGKVMKRRQAPGLALLILAKSGTSPEDRAWIGSLYDDAMITTSKNIEQEALALVDKWKSVHGDPAGNTLQTSATVSGEPAGVPEPVRSPARQLKGLNLDNATNTDSYSDYTTRATVPPAAATPTGQ